MCPSLRLLKEQLFMKSSEKQKPLLKPKKKRKTCSHNLHITSPSVDTLCPIKRISAYKNLKSSNIHLSFLSLPSDPTLHFSSPCFCRKLFMETDDMSLRVASFSCYLDATKDNLVRKLSAQEKNINSSPITKPPPFSIKFSKSSQENSLANLHVDSFSYLNTSGDSNNNNFVFEIPGPIEDPTSAFTFSQEIPKDGEIGVFNADKYFNMKLEYKTEARTKYKNEVPENPPNIKPKTPSYCSESTSWNSQTALIPDNIQRIGSTKHKKAIGRKIFTGFGCKGPCFDKKAVAYFSSKPTQTGSEGIDPKLITANKDQLLKIQSLDESRPSIEVFGSSNRLKGDIATNMERKLSMLTWDAIPKSGKTLNSTSSSTVIFDDMASEASSDLFEIDNISGSINFPSLTLSEPTDDVSTCMSPNSHYAPSEASIQWSVVTASAADYSVLSDCNDSVSVAGDLILKNNNNRISKAKIFEGAQKGRVGGLLGCKSHKAVDVAEINVVCQKSNTEKGKHNQGRDLNGKSGRVTDNIENALKLPRTLANGGLSVQYPSIL